MNFVLVSDITTHSTYRNLHCHHQPCCSAQHSNQFSRYPHEYLTVHKQGATALVGKSRIAAALLWIMLSTLHMLTIHTSGHAHIPRTRNIDNKRLCLMLFIMMQPKCMHISSKKTGHYRTTGLRHGPVDSRCKGSPYSITERRVSQLIPVLDSQPAGEVNHKPDGRLPLLSARPAVTPATLKRATTNFAAW